jgi:hypothetical protein
MAFDIANPIGTGTDAELLEFTRATIAQVTLHGQSYTHDGRQLVRADLPALWEQVRILEARIGSSSRRSSANIASLRRAE